jgi:hypothetical protein
MGNHRSKHNDQKKPNDFPLTIPNDKICERTIPETYPPLHLVTSLTPRPNEKGGRKAAQKTES